MLGTRHEIVGAVARIDRLDQNRDVVFRGHIGRAGEIVDEYLLGRGARLRGNLSGKTVDLPPPDRHHIVEGLAKQRREVRLASGDSGKPEFAGLAPAGRRVDAEHSEAMSIKLGLYGGRREFIGKL